MEDMIAEIEEIIADLENKKNLQPEINNDREYHVDQVYIPVLQGMLDEVVDMSRARFADEIFKGNDSQLQRYVEEKRKDTTRLLEGVKSKKRKALLEKDLERIEVIANNPQKFFEKYQKRENIPTQENVEDKLDNLLLDSLNKLASQQDWSFITHPEQDPVKFQMWVDWIFDKNQNYNDVVRYQIAKFKTEKIEEFEKFIQEHKGELIAMGDRIDELSGPELDNFKQLLGTVGKISPVLSDPIPFKGTSPKERYESARPSIEHIEELVMASIEKFKQEIEEIEKRVPAEQIKEGSFLGKYDGLSATAVYANRKDGFSGTAKEVFQRLTDLKYLIERYKQTKDIKLEEEIQKEMEDGMKDMINDELNAPSFSHKR